MRLLTMAFIVATAVTMLSEPAPLYAQCCGAGGCRPGLCAPPAAAIPFYIPPAAIAAEQDYTWRDVPGNADQTALYLGGVQVGNWHRSIQRFTVRAGDKWGHPGEAPFPPPADAIVRQRKVSSKPPAKCDPQCECCDACPCVGATAAAAELPAYALDGVQSAKIVHGKDYVNGREVTREQFNACLRGDATIPKDDELIRITCIGTETCRKQVRDLMSSPAMSGIRDQVVYKDYPPGHWAIAPGFVQTGDCQVYVQRPNGEVAVRLEHVPSAEEVNSALKLGIRKPDANYDKSKDLTTANPLPDPNKPAWPALPFTPAHGLMLGGIALGVFLLLLKGARA